MDRFVCKRFNLPIDVYHDDQLDRGDYCSDNCYIGVVAAVDSDDVGGDDVFLYDVFQHFVAVAVGVVAVVDVDFDVGADV